LSVLDTLSVVLPLVVSLIALFGDTTVRGSSKLTRLGGCVLLAIILMIPVALSVKWQSNIRASIQATEDIERFEQTVSRLEHIQGGTDTQINRLGSILDQVKNLNTWASSIISEFDQLSTDLENDIDNRLSPLNQDHLQVRALIVGFNERFESHRSNLNQEMVNVVRRIEDSETHRDDQVRTLTTDINNTKQSIESEIGEIERRVEEFSQSLSNVSQQVNALSQMEAERDLEVSERLDQIQGILTESLSSPTQTESPEGTEVDDGRG